MLWVLAFHIIAVIAWFAGLFYLPRLYVYHCQAIQEQDTIGSNRFKTMEYKLFWYIMTPAGLIATALGLWLVALKPTLLHETWFQLKLGLAACLWLFHLTCGYYLSKFKQEKNQKPEKYFRFFNEIPTIILISVIILAIIQPF
jgi:protoporphyrinogen IX oxidase